MRSCDSPAHLPDPPACSGSAEDALHSEASATAAAALSSLGLPTGLSVVSGTGRRLTFLSPGAVVHVARPGGAALLARETLVLDALPPSVGAPRVLGVDLSAPSPWQVQERLPGVSLHLAWPSMGEDERLRALQGAAGVLTALHSVPSSSVPEEDAPAWGFLGVDGVLDRLASCEERGLVPAPLASWVRSWVAARPGLAAPSPASERVVCHRDFGPRNLLWDGSRVGVVDFEHAGVDERDFELASIRVHLRSLSPVGGRSAEAVLASAYPLLWSHPAREDRLLLMRVVRRLVVLEDPSVPPSTSRTLLVELASLVGAPGLSGQSLPHSSLPTR